MTTIKKIGEEAYVESRVLEYSGFDNTLNNVKEYVNGLHMSDLNDLFDNPDNYNKVPQNRALLNILNGVEFEELGFEELADFVELVKVIGLDRYELYSLPEYAYMYTSLVEYFEGY